MAKFCSLFSSSSGNCTYIGDDNGGILIDIGVSAKKTEAALKEIGVDPCSIKAAFFTHEHTDHIAGAKVFAGKYNIPVYATKGTLTGMYKKDIFSKGVEAFIMPAEGYDFDGFFVKPFNIKHDSNEPCGYTVSLPCGKKIGVATDMGIVTDTVAKAVLGCDLVLLESNHDEDMLMMGPYPYTLKERVRSEYGHLSNNACAEFAAWLFEGGTKSFVLGHLSKENNLPHLAYQTTFNALTEKGANEEDFSLYVAGDKIIPITL